MGIELTKQVLKMLGADPNSYDLELEGEVKCYNGLAIKNVVIGYYFYEVINGEKHFLEHLSNLDTLCSHLIKKHKEGGNPYYWSEQQRIAKLDEYKAPFREADRKFRQSLKEYAAEYEKKLKQEGTSSKMTFEELKYILIKEDINPYSWDILEDGYISEYDGYVLKKAENGGYDIFYMERGQYDLLKHADDEYVACIEFLKLLIEDGDTKLIKYVNFDELLDDSLLVEPNFKGYILMDAIALSKKLGRPLTDEESKQFER